MQAPCWHVYRCVVVTEAGLYLRLIDFCITQPKAQGPSRTCNESKEEEEEEVSCLDLSARRLQSPNCDIVRILAG